jgi:WD40 repeat protein
MKKLYAFTVLLVFLASIMYAQKSAMQNQRITTDFEKGRMIEFSTVGAPVTGQQETGMSGKGASLNWQGADIAAIANYVKTSGTNLKSACAWGLNSQRLSVYNNTSNVPLWEKMCPINTWDEVIDMTDDGTLTANGFDSAFQIYNTATGDVVWEQTTQDAVRGIQITNDGQTVFVATFNFSTQTDSYLACYHIGQSVPIWSKTLVGNFTAMTASKSGNRVVFCEYGGLVNKMYVLDGANGNQLFEAPFQNQNPPGISYDGKYIVSGDYSGYIYLYEFDEGANTYNEKWHYRVNGSSAWIWGMNISGDGSTIAVGTLVFLTAGYDGELYVFNTYSPVPLWTAAGFGDAVVSVDLSYDGSIIAAGSWGPLENNRPDFMLYRKQSPTPYYNINSPGSIFSVDLSADGKLCMAGGKAVHARAFGNGGKLYNITSNPGGGILSGHAYKSGTTDQAGVKVEVIGISNYFTYTNGESAYSLPYIPGGTYTVKYSCVGFVPQEITGVVITDAQTTVQDVTLLSTGDPPQNLVATQGAGLTVNLSWAPPQTGTVLGYKVYRKNFAPDYFPETPIATLAPTEHTYINTTALPTMHYFYAVTAVLAGDLQSPYSNTAEGWISTGYMAPELSSYVGTTPVIDGIISAGEWTDAFRADISDFLGTRDNTPQPIGSVIAYFKVNAAKTSLYCAVENFNDVVLEDHDEVAFYVDDNNDKAFPPTGDDSEGNYWPVHYATGDLIRYRPLYNNGGVGTTIEIPNPQIHVSASTGHVVYEFVIPLGPGENWNINFNGQSQSGICSFVLDDPSNFDGYWPVTNLNLFNPAGYGVINFGDEDEVPPPPANLALLNQPPSMDIRLTWNQPDINDFDHFNIYSSVDLGIFNIIGTTVGVEFFYTLPSGGSYVFYVTTVDRAGHESIPSETVTVGGGTSYMLNGTITYANAAQTQLAGIAIDLKNASGTVIGSTTTNANGGFTFGGLLNGNYTLAPSTTKLWGGVTAADVLLFKKHIANVSYLTGIFLASGDVNASGTLTAADVLLIKKRIAFVTNSFTVGDWFFNNGPVTINGANQTQNFNGLCFGDANGSYLPREKGPFFPEPPQRISGMLTIGSAVSLHGTVTVPVFASEVRNLGSFQYTLSYDPSKLTFTGAGHWYNGIDNVVIGNPQPGKLTFVWAADASGISLANEKLVDLLFTSNSTETSAIAWSDEPTIREFADYEGAIFAPVYKDGSIGATSGVETAGSQLVVYPNPARDFIMIRSAEALKSVKIFNNLGEVVYDKTSPASEFRVSTATFRPGLYMVRIETNSGLTNRSIVIEK